MALTKQTWHLDTCGCVVEETFDNEDPNVPHQFYAMVQICPAHQPLATNKIPSNIQKEKQKKIDMLVGMLDRNEERNLSDVRKLHKENGSEGINDIFVRAKKMDGTTIIKQVPSLARTLNFLKGHRHNNISYYEQLFSQPDSFAIEAYNAAVKQNAEKKRDVLDPDERL